MPGPEIPPATGMRALWRRYPRAVAGILLSLAALVAINAMLAARFLRYRDEIGRLRAAMTGSERSRADLILASEQHRMRVAIELLRRQARRDQVLHLSVEVDSGRMYLERDGAVLREMQVRIEPRPFVEDSGVTARLLVPRGARTVTQLVGADEEWLVPESVYIDRGLDVPADRRVTGALGRLGVVLNGGLVLYARPARGPLADTTYVMPGSILLDDDDVRAIAPNMRRGMTVYFY